MTKAASLQKLLPFLLSLAFFVVACKPTPHSYSVDGFSVVFPGAFEVRSSDEDTPAGKVHMTGAVCERASEDSAFLTTTFPPALIARFSEAEILRKQLAETMRRMNATVLSSQVNTNSPIPYLDFTIQIPTDMKGHGEGRLYYRDHKTYLISVSYPTRTAEAAAYMKSIQTPVP